MSIQFNNYFNKTIQWSDEQAENSLRAVSLAQKNTTLIHTDLSVTQNNFFSQVIWNIFSLIPCIRNWIFQTNLEYSVTVLQQLKPQIEGKDSNIIALFNQAVINVAQFASCLTPAIKEQLLINQECSFHEHQVALFAQSSLNSHDRLNHEKFEEEEVNLFEVPLATNCQEVAPALELCEDVWQINATKVLFVKNIDVTSQNEITFVTFKSSSNYSILKNETASTIKIFLKKQRCDKKAQLTTAVNKALIDSRAAGSKKVIFNLPIRKVSALNIEETARIFASTIKTYITGNPSSFDEITLVGTSKNASHTDSYSSYINESLK